MWKNIFRSVLIAISYYSIKKAIDKLPKPYRKTAVLILRGSVYFVLMLVIFSFLSGRVDVISKSIESIPRILNNLLMSLAFIVSILFSLLMTAFVEEVYRKVSAVHDGTKDKIDKIQEIQRNSGEAVKKSFNRSKAILGETVTVITDSTKSLYDTSTKVTGASVDKADQLIKRVLRKKKE